MPPAASTIEQIRAEMMAIYVVSKPRKLEDVDALLEEWEGDELELLDNIRSRYLAPDPEPEPEPESGPAAGKVTVAFTEPGPLGLRLLEAEDGTVTLVGVVEGRIIICIL